MRCNNNPCSWGMIFLCVVFIIVGLSCSKSSDPDGNRPPTVPTNDVASGSPPDGSTDISITPTLYWNCSDPDVDELKYDVYFGTDSFPPIASSIQLESFYTTDTLEYETPYFWKIVARDKYNLATVSPIWNFTTGSYQDTVPPTTLLLYPTDGIEVSDTVWISVDATDNDTVVAVDFYIDGQVYCSDSALPYVCDWITTDHPDSSQVSIFAVACDLFGNCDTSITITVTVINNKPPPITYLTTDSLYVNAVDASSPSPGVHLSWYAVDTSFGIRELEYEWRLYGPFDDTATIYVTLIDGEEILTLSMIPPTLHGMSQPLMYSKGPNHDIDSSDVWVANEDTTLYNLFEGITVEESAKFKFVFWVRGRTENSAPDPLPPFGQFLVYEIKNPKSVAVFDETGFTLQNGRWAPRDLDTAKAVFHQYIHGAGYTDFDTTSGVDYFFMTNRQNSTTPIEPQVPDLIDVLSHRIIICYSDDAEICMIEDPDFGFMHDVFLGLDVGVSAWVLSRNLGDATYQDTLFVLLDKSDIFETCFGVASVNCEGWLNGVLENISAPVFTEEFIGVQSMDARFPDIDIDLSLLDNRYPRWFADTAHQFLALPEVGIGNKTAQTTAIYSYLSADTGSSNFHSHPCGFIQETDGMRSACWMFTPLAMESTAMQEAFTAQLAWLDGTPGRASLSGIQKRRERIRHFLHYLSHYASADERVRYGINMKPFEVTAGKGN